MEIYDFFIDMNINLETVSIRGKTAFHSFGISKNYLTVFLLTFFFKIIGKNNKDEILGGYVIHFINQSVGTDCVLPCRLSWN